MRKEFGPPGPQYRRTTGHLAAHRQDRRHSGDQGRRQDHHRPHHAGGQEASLPLQYPGVCPVCLRGNGRGFCPQGNGQQKTRHLYRHCGRAELRAGIKPGACRDLPEYLGVRVVLAKSIERIHAANLINFGILPLLFLRGEDYDTLQAGTAFTADNLIEAVKNKETFHIPFNGRSVEISLRITRRQREILLDGGLLHYTRRRT